jgi:pimeloyl-ACP methyl ester carboxylesterase
MTTFSLIHGGFCSARCWDLLAAELEARDAGAIAIDLPIDDPDAQLDDRAAMVAASIAAVDDEVVVVGNSGGGLLVPMVAAIRPVVHAVYIAGAVPRPGRPIGEYYRDHPGMVKLPPNLPLDERGASYLPDNVARELFFHDCAPELQEWALTTLRPSRSKTRDAACPLLRCPGVPSTYIVCEDDHALDPSDCAAMARELLGVEPITIPGGHMPQVSRPAMLADLLLSLVD